MDNQNLLWPEDAGNDGSVTETPPTEKLGDGTAASAEDSCASVPPSSDSLPSTDGSSVNKTLATSQQEALLSQEKECEEGDVPALSSTAEIKAALEALLFATTEPLSVARLTKILGGPSQSDVRSALIELQIEYDSAPRGVQIVEVAGGFQMATRPYYAPWIFRLKPSRRRNPLSQATLETLAIIAYKQPITRAEIEAIRGVDSTATIHTLLDLGLIEVGGKREIPGRPQLYVTTEQFLKTFGLKSLGDLPSIQELRRMFSGDNKAEPKPRTASIDTSVPSADTSAVPPHAAERSTPSDVPSLPEDASSSLTTATKEGRAALPSEEGNDSAQVSHE